MRDEPSICKYLDIPFQHSSDTVLKFMQRGIDKKKTYELIDLINNKIPGVSLRTTLMVGHPGETEEDFRELLSFVRDVEFDRLGVFTYSEEEDTFSEKNYSDLIPQSVKDDRANEVMKLQQEISYKKNMMKVGQTFKVLIDREDGENYYGRTEADAPEVDNEVILSKKDGLLEVGAFYNTKIEGAWEYDLLGKAENKKPLND
jgi:ribosomal protein S12 methylthiotransferase